MKNIVITGKDSYIGNHIQEWLESKGGYTVTQVDVVTDEWKLFDFEGTDAVVHVAGIVHRPDVTDWALYEKVNVRLPEQIAMKAKSQGVKQFVFLSTMAVYGVGKKLSPNMITDVTAPAPKGMYGKSKLMAENILRELENSDFQVSIIRPPNVYGYQCKGNYIPGFTSIVRRLPIIPKAYDNVKQSMLYIDNLCEFIRLLIDECCGGVYLPQDREPISAIQLMEGIASGMGRKIQFSKLLGLPIYLIAFVPLVKKAYGGIAYSKETSAYFSNRYCVVSFQDAVKYTLGKR